MIVQTRFLLRYLIFSRFPIILFPSNIFKEDFHMISLGFY